jgi:hypothetical protein
MKKNDTRSLLIDNRTVCSAGTDDHRTSWPQQINHSAVRCIDNGNRVLHCDTAMTAPQDQAVEVRRNRWHQSTLDSLLNGCSFQHYLIYIKGLDQGPKPHAAVGLSLIHI